MEKEIFIENFMISVYAVIPMFCMLLMGVLIKRFKVLNETELPQVNKLVFCVFLPLLLFLGIYRSQLSDVIDPGLIFFTLAAIFFIYSGALLFTLLIEKNNVSRGSVIQAIYRSNVIIMGVPLVSGIYGGSNLETIALMVSITVPLYNVLAVITLEIFRGPRVSPHKIVSGILKNPLIIGGAAGILFALLHIQLPSVLEKLVSEMAGAATPLAVIVLGASLKYSSIGGGRRNLIICVAGRLAVVPGIVLPAAAFLGFRDVAFVTLIAIFASPCSVSSFTMAQQMNSDSALTANSIAFTSVLACFTMFFWIFLFRQLGMF